MKEDIILKEVGSLRSEFKFFRDEVNGKFEVNDGRLGSLEEDSKSLKSDVSELKTDVAALKTDVSTIAGAVARNTEDICFIKENMLTVDDIQVFSKQQDDIIRMFRNFNEECAAANSRITNHEGRIVKLEKNAA